MREISREKRKIPPLIVATLKKNSQEKEEKLIERVTPQRLTIFNSQINFTVVSSIRKKTCTFFPPPPPPLRNNYRRANVPLPSRVPGTRLIVDRRAVDRG